MAPGIADAIKETVTGLTDNKKIASIQHDIHK